MEPPKNTGARGGLGVPALLNLLAMAVLWQVAEAHASYGSREEAAGNFFFLLLGLLAADALACVVLAFMRPMWAAGFALAALLVVLIGLGTCGYSLSHMHVN